MSILHPMPLVIIESPYRPTAERTLEQHQQYLLQAMAHSIRMGEAPMASHHLLPQILMDDTPYERALGVRIGLSWGQHADLVAVYADLGVSPGMKQAIDFYKGLGKKIEWRGIDSRLVREILAL